MHKCTYLNAQYSCCFKLYTIQVLKDIACGHFHTLAVSSRDELFTWGMNSHGQLGLGCVHCMNVQNAMASY